MKIVKQSVAEVLFRSQFSCLAANLDKCMSWKISHYFEWLKGLL